MWSESHKLIDNFFLKFVCSISPVFTIVFPIINYQINLGIIYCSDNGKNNSSGNKDCYNSAAYWIHFSFAMINLIISILLFICLHLFYKDFSPFKGKVLSGPPTNLSYVKVLFK